MAYDLKARIQLTYDHLVRKGDQNTMNIMRDMVRRIVNDPKTSHKQYLDIKKYLTENEGKKMGLGRFIESLVIDGKKHRFSGNIEELAHHGNVSRQDVLDSAGVVVQDVVATKQVRLQEARKFLDDITKATENIYNSENEAITQRMTSSLEQLKSNLETTYKTLESTYTGVSTRLPDHLEGQLAPIESVKLVKDTISMTEAGIAKVDEAISKVERSHNIGQKAKAVDIPELTNIRKSARDTVDTVIRTVEEKKQGLIAQYTAKLGETYEQIRKEVGAIYEQRRSDIENLFTKEVDTLKTQKEEFLTKGAQKIFKDLANIDSTLSVEEYNKLTEGNFQRLKDINATVSASSSGIKNKMSDDTHNGQSIIADFEKIAEEMVQKLNLPDINESDISSLNFDVDIKELKKEWRTCEVWCSNVKINSNALVKMLREYTSGISKAIEKARMGAAQQAEEKGGNREVLQKNVMAVFDGVEDEMQSRFGAMRDNVYKPKDFVSTKLKQYNLRLSELSALPQTNSIHAVKMAFEEVVCNVSQSLVQMDQALLSMDVKYNEFNNSLWGVKQNITQNECMLQTNYTQAINYTELLDNYVKQMQSLCNVTSEETANIPVTTGVSLAIKELQRIWERFKAALQSPAWLTANGNNTVSVYDTCTNITNVTTFFAGEMNLQIVLFENSNPEKVANDVYSYITSPNMTKLVSEVDDIITAPKYMQCGDDKACIKKVTMELIAKDFDSYDKLKTFCKADDTFQYDRYYPHITKEQEPMFRRYCEQAGAHTSKKLVEERYPSLRNTELFREIESVCLKDCSIAGGLKYREGVTPRRILDLLFSEDNRCKSDRDLKPFPLLLLKYFFNIILPDFQTDIAKGEGSLYKAIYDFDQGLAKKIMNVGWTWGATTLKPGAEEVIRALCVNSLFDGSKKDLSEETKFVQTVLVPNLLSSGAIILPDLSQISKKAEGFYADLYAVRGPAMLYYYEIFSEEDCLCSYGKQRLHDSTTNICQKGFDPLTCAKVGFNTLGFTDNDDFKTLHQDYINAVENAKYDAACYAEHVRAEIAINSTRAALLAENHTVINNVYGNGSVVFSYDNTTITGNITAVNDTVIVDNTTITGNITAVNDTVTVDNTTITGNITTVNDTVIVDNTTITGNITAVNDTVTVDNTTITGNITTVNDTVIVDDITITGNIMTVNDTVIVDNTTIIDNITAVNDTVIVDNITIV